MTGLNDALSHARAKPIDFLLLGSAAVMPFTLIAWALRHRKHRSKHKKILVDQIRVFNDAHAAKGLRLRWRRKPASELVLERIPPTIVPPGQGVSRAGETEGEGEVVEEEEQKEPEEEEEEEEEEKEEEEGEFSAGGGAAAAEAGNRPPSMRSGGHRPPLVRQGNGARHDGDLTEQQKQQKQQQLGPRAVTAVSHRANAAEP